MKSRNLGWRLDYFVMSANYRSKYQIELIDSIINDKMKGSDHCPITLKLKVPVKEGEIAPKKAYKISNATEAM